MVKCYSGVENHLKVCDLVDVIGILEMPAHHDVEEEEDVEETEVVIHAVTIKKRQLHEIVKSQSPTLSSGTPPAYDLQFLGVFILKTTLLFGGW